MQDLTHLADLIRIRNYVNSSVSRIIGHPAEVGHIAEYVLAQILDIELAAVSNFKALDGHFASGNLSTRSVNIKYRSSQKLLLNMESSTLTKHHADFYVVVQGPSGKLKASDDFNLPFVIDKAYLFESAVLVPAIAKPDKIKIGRFVPTALWKAAMIYPEQVNQTLILTDEQRDALALFAPIP